MRRRQRARGDPASSHLPVCAATRSTSTASLPQRGAHPRHRGAAGDRQAARRTSGCGRSRRSLHMCFTGNPGTGKTTVALRMARDPASARLCAQGPSGRRDARRPGGQYIGHTAPKTREVLKKAMGGVLFIDEAYYLYRPENERDYGQEAIEILLQVMENQRDDLVVILAGYQRSHGDLLQENPGMSSRIAHHLDFPDYASRRAAAHRRPHARRHELPLRRRRARGLRRATSAAHAAAAFRQCAQRAQRARPRAAAPGEPPASPSRRAS